MKNKLVQICLITMMIIIPSCVFAQGQDTSATYAVPVQGTWQSDASGWWYQTDDRPEGYLVSEFAEIEGVTYYFKASGYVATGWTKINKEWYYFQPSGAMVHGEWKQIDGHYFYFDAEGKMAVNTTIENSYVGPDGAWMPEGWHHDGIGWQYITKAGKLAQRQGYILNQKLYAFNRSGYMITGWVTPDKESDNKKWYYLHTDGHMAIDEWVGDYCFDEFGVMVTDSWALGDDGRDYYIGSDGKYIPDKWVKEGNRWKYLLGDGNFIENDYLFLNGKSYYFDQKGYMKTGWIQFPNDWSYAHGDGHIAFCEWIGDCYLDTFGIMCRDMWIYNGENANKYYVGSDGKRIPNKWEKRGEHLRYHLGDGTYVQQDFCFIDGERYYFDILGDMITGWHKVDSAENAEHWIYAKSSGALIRNQWLEDYFFDDKGMTIANGFVDGYYLDNKGKCSKKPVAKWVKDKKGWKYDISAAGLKDKYFNNTFEAHINNRWYGFDENGYMLKGWVQDKVNNEWYYFHSDGTRGCNEWVGQYWVDENGIMVKNSWVDNDNYYVDGTGRWEPHRQ